MISMISDVMHIIMLMCSYLRAHNDCKIQIFESCLVDYSDLVVDEVEASKNAETSKTNHDDLSKL